MRRRNSQNSDYHPLYVQRLLLTGLFFSLHQNKNLTLLVSPSFLFFSQLSPWLFFSTFFTGIAFWQSILSYPFFPKGSSYITPQTIYTYVHCCLEHPSHALFILWSTFIHPSEISLNANSSWKLFWTPLPLHLMEIPGLCFSHSIPCKFQHSPSFTVK